MFAWQNLSALLELGHEVRLVVTQRDQSIDRTLEASLEGTVYCVPIRPPRVSADRVLGRFFRHDTMPFRLPEWQGIRAQVRADVGRTQPDLIWADGIHSLLHAPKGQAPIVYAHHDFLHQIRQVQKRAAGRRLARPDIVSIARLARMEADLIAQAGSAISVSASDVPALEEMGTPTTYVPVVGTDIPLQTHAPAARPRVVLFGRSNTAMTMARKTLREEVWPLISPELRGSYEWLQVGELPKEGAPDRRWLEDNFQTLGFVEELSTVLRPQDLCLVPYREDTGFRVKFVTAAAYGLVNIGFCESFACAPEFVPGVNCLAGESPSALVELLEQYASSSSLRSRLSRASRDLYDASFTLRGRLSSYEHAIQVADARERSILLGPAGT